MPRANVVTIQLKAIMNTRTRCSFTSKSPIAERLLQRHVYNANYVITNECCFALRNSDLFVTCWILEKLDLCIFLKATNRIMWKCLKSSSFLFLNLINDNNSWEVLTKMFQLKVPVQNRNVKNKNHFFYSFILSLQILYEMTVLDSWDISIRSFRFSACSEILCETHLR